MSKQSILEQALLQVQDLEEAVKANAKGILASTMKEELNDVLKESMEEEVVEGNETPITEDENDMPISEQPEGDDEEGNDDEASINDEPMDDEDPDMDVEGDDESDDLSLDGDDELELPSADMDDMEGDDDVLDMTDASDEEVLKVFKSMKPEDGIVVKRDGDNVELEDGDDEYIIKLDGEEGEVAEGHDEEAHEGGYDEEVSEEEDCQECGDSMEEEVSEEEVAEGDDTVYEIELEDMSEEVDEEVSEEVSEEMEEEVSEEVSEEDDSQEGEVDEASRTMGNDVRGEGPRQGKKYKAGRAEINEEVETLKKQNAEYKKALVLFKDKLNEVAVFNANLAYATRLFTEHSTTRQEKMDILKRFDSVTSLTESKSTYKTIAGELGSKKNVTETVVDKIASTPTTSSSQEVLSEAKAYESPQFKRMKDLMSKIK